MIKATTDSETGVIELRMSGKVTVQDYADVLVPTLEAASDGTGSLRLVVDFEGDEIPDYTVGAMGSDMRAGIHYWRDFERIAVVTDSVALRRLAPLASAVIPGQVEVFTLGDREAARAWAAAGHE